MVFLMMLLLLMFQSTFMFDYIYLKGLLSELQYVKLVSIPTFDGGLVVVVVIVLMVLVILTMKAMIMIAMMKKTMRVGVIVKVMLK